MRWIVTTLLLACRGAPVEEPPILVRDGVVQGAGAEGQPLADGRVLTPLRWRPGERVQTTAGERVAPQIAECIQLFQVPLGDVSRHIARGGGPPDTAMAFSPDGRWLAIGSYAGEVLVVDGWSGAVRARRVLSETLVKQVAWAKDGQTLYAAEQSPDAFVHALDPSTLRSRGQIRLADHVGSSPAPPGDDLYGVYALPAAYSLEVLTDGALLVAATHGWNEGGERRNQARLLRLGADLQIQGAWPEEGAADAVFRSVAVGPTAIAVPVGRSADGPAPEGLPVGGVQVLDHRLKPLRAVQIEPLRPWFDDVFVWEALALGPEDALAVGLGDGRVQVQGEVWPLGSPVMAGEIPIAASVGQLAWPRPDTLLAVTAYTNIPWGAAAPDLRPPEAHPSENTLTALRRDGSGALSLGWSWRSPHALQGLTLSEDGRTLVVGAGARQTDARHDLFGALVFDLEGEGTGSDRLRAICGTEGPVFFRQALAADGRIAVAEHPWMREGRLEGAYRVTVLR